MTANNTPATDAGDKYRDVTAEFARRLPKAWNELNRKNWQLVRNAEVAAIFRGGDRREEGEALLTCGTHRQGDSIKDLLKYTHYCRKPYSCVRCGTILAQYRAEQLMEASELFSVESTQGFKLKVMTALNLVLCPVCSEIYRDYVHKDLGKQTELFDHLTNGRESDFVVCDFDVRRDQKGCVLHINETHLGDIRDCLQDDDADD
ncbi:hypothetical protein [Rhodopirellula europaea]|uniref:hypothetical protein n=1 Tax=Rhodopirellula europaea TaxID=1263866 RepID=UPI0011819869|nr:hypothetical protein [Rhodopirellula europaea]